MHRSLESQLIGLSRYAYCLCGDREIAKDLVQTCALKAISAKKVPSGHSEYQAWIFTILRNVFLDHLRKSAAEGSVLVEMTENCSSEGNNQAHSRVYITEQRNINILTVREGLARLKATQREILLLVDIIGFSYAEVAEVLQIPLGTVMSRLSRSRNALLREIDDNHAEVTTVIPISKAISR